MRINKLILLASLFSSLAIADTTSSPYPKTLGATNPDVTQTNIQDTICTKGYTKTIRPPVSYTNKLKKNQIREYGYEDKNPNHYEEDHIVNLSIGGHPSDPRNLFPQVIYSCKGNAFNCSQEDRYYSEWNAKKKDALELKLRNMVCRGDITLSEAQGAIAGDWIKAYKKYGGDTYIGIQSN